MSDAKDEAEIKQDYLLNRDSDESARLTQQHQVWTTNLGYLIHPMISKSLGPSARIADVATGTGIWLLDLEKRAQQPGWKLYGLDVSDQQFSAPDELPANVTLQVANMKQPFPEQLLGQFDLVHVRLVLLAMGSADMWLKTVENLRTLLKPGGWLQWEEIDILPLHSALRTDDPHVPRENLQRGFERLIELTGPRVFQAHHLLLKGFKQSGLHNVTKDVVSSDRVPEMREAATVVEAGVLLGVGRQQISDGIIDAWARDELESVYEGMKKEAKLGGYNNFYIHCTIGQNV